MIRIRVVSTISSCLVFFLTLATLACGGDAPAPVEPPPKPKPPPLSGPDEPEPPSLTQIRLLELQTYDGSGQVVHPDVTLTPEHWSRRRRHLVITPYPNGNSSRENPSIFLADNGLSWKVHDSVSNPIAYPATGAYLSDPDELYNPDTKELWVYYRQVTRENEIYLIRSGNAITWSSPVLVANAPNHQLVSPTVVRRGTNDWLMWSINSGGAGCSATTTTVELRRSSDGITWSAPKSVALPSTPLSAWHIDVQWIPSRKEFWAIYNAKTPGGCATAALYFAKSLDGIRWTVFPRPLLERGVIPEFQDIVYRSTFQYDADRDEIMFWYSGARYEGGEYIWKAAVQRLDRADVFALERPLKAETRGQLRGMMAPRETSAPPLTNETAP